MRTFFLLLILMGNLAIWSRPWMSSNNPYSRAPVRLRPTPTPSGRILAQVQLWAPLTAILTGSLYFAIDASRRRYKSDKTTAVALAWFGLLSLGITSVIYYVIWGNLPRRPADELFGFEFCPDCLDVSSPAQVGDLLTHDAILGARWMGSSYSCPQCRSCVQTLWVWLLVPLVPLGSYRVIWLSENRFVARRAAWDLRHVLLVYALVLIPIIAGLLAYILSQN